MEEQLTTVETAMQLGLLIEEFEKIKGLLGRTPNFTELSAFSVMWSEHCCYKSSILWLKKLPKSSPRMLAEAGEENAGLVDIGNGLACAFKIESHNHPSAIEPYQGAATGVGGINRDIFTMGARPIALLNTLRFGDINLEKTKHLLRGVVKGIGDYGNAFGVPTVGGEVYFDSSYNTNPLVNAFSAGIVETDKVASAIALGVGNPVFIVGSATGKDGIHGAAFASKDITEDSAKDLPSVQVGDPFQEKLLLEATLEVIATKNVVGIQDMGAAGIICSSSEMSAKGEHGMDIDLDKVPLRQENMLPFEILLSESQERMLVVVEKGKEQEILDIFDKWDLNCAEIGTVTESSNVRFFQKGELVADIPANALVLGGDAPIYEHSYTEPDYFQQYKQFKTEDVPEPTDYAEVAQFLMKHPNIVSRQWIYEQYDSMVGTANASTNSPADAAVVHVKGADQAIVITVDCNGRYVQADPKIGAMIAVCESARNVVCAGGDPVAITNNLNFGNPYNQEVYWQFVQSVKGIIEACEKLETPVTGGNVSFYNQASTVSKEGGNVTNAVLPTPTIGMLGLMDNLEHRMTLDFKNVGDIIYVIGEPKNDIAGSEYLTSYHNFKESSAPHFDLEAEYDLQQTVKALIRDKQIQSAHDISDGGLFITLAESAMPRDLGFSILTTFDEIDVRKDAFLFGESQSRVVVTIKAEDQDRFEDFMKEQSVPFFEVGVVTVSDFKVDTHVLMTTEEAKDVYNNTLGRHMDGGLAHA
ncbi:phosphoribosylformylglycinamidine synthase subunit PurL [uncultured Microscilla sp.]|uniref:phosphoribosylformylglycinamidine synthase subunit PurL n=1 Tax=uncultured Microscilla sp. TaxID=432653 RepID=UPI002602AC11|nr:phosphoribosylformylglycinamidine synthase subunit PurL [uncultured Microscilla sp.]